MEHFYENIQGWSVGLPEIYKPAIDRASSTEPSRFVEVGVWKGRSAAYMYVEIINSGKPIEFTCVDTWVGDGNESDYLNDEICQSGKLYDHFLDNMRPVQHVLKTIKKKSVEAANDFENHSLDFVCIDASHDYESVLADINAWKDKIKPGGVLAGHDYTYHRLPPGVIATLADMPVARAVHTVFDKDKINGTNYGCWYTFL